MTAIQRFLGDTEGLAFHEPVVIVYERELKALEQRMKGLEPRVRLLAVESVRVSREARNLSDKLHKLLAEIQQEVIAAAEEEA